MTTVVLHQFAPALGLPNASPFCMKAEAYLRLAGVDYRRQTDALPLRAPRRKLPWIEDGPTVVADSHFIVRHLEATRGAPLDGWLSARQRAEGHAIARMLEESTYFAILHGRWVDDDGWARTRAAFFGAMPPPLPALVGGIVRRKIRRDCAGQGIGLRSADERAATGRADLDALATLLEGRAFVLGERASSVDAVALAFVANIVRVPVETPLKAHALGLPALTGYCDRMMARVFPEFDR